jgi:choice-of-anchor B domain-containing protein
MKKTVNAALALFSGLFLVAVTAYAFEAAVKCENERAGLFSCRAVDLQSKVNLGATGLVASRGSGGWGWTDPKDGHEYAIMGLDTKASFVDITDPVNPVHVADLPAQTVASGWREIITLNNYALVVSEAMGHGMQILDLTQLGALPRNKVTILEPTAHYDLVGSGHTVTANNKSGYAYILGSDTCDQGAHVVDMREPTKPKFATCIDRQVFDPIPKKDTDDGDEVYTHDMVCVIYAGPDVRYKDHEICIASNDNSVNLVDATDKANPKQISAVVHPSPGFVHQGWFTEDFKYFLVNDEYDEVQTQGNVKTYIYDFSDLEKPKFMATHDHGYKGIDHNLYVKGNYVYEANYLSGLRILNLKDIAQGKLTEVAHFDTTPGREAIEFGGVWNIYPFFKSGNVILTNIEDATLYIVKPNLE